MKKQLLVAFVGSLVASAGLRAAGVGTTEVWVCNRSDMPLKVISVKTNDPENKLMLETGKAGKSDEIPINGLVPKGMNQRDAKIVARFRRSGFATGNMWTVNTTLHALDDAGNIVCTLQLKQEVGSYLLRESKMYHYGSITVHPKGGEATGSYSKEFKIPAINTSDPTEQKLLRELEGFKKIQLEIDDTFRGRTYRLNFWPFTWAFKSTSQMWYEFSAV